MGSYLLILADIATKMRRLEGIGVVYDYERGVVDMNKFIQLFTGEAVAGRKPVLGWEVTRVAVRESKNGSTYFRHHRFRAAGYQGLMDAEETEKGFQVLVEKICSAFRAAEPEGRDADPWFYLDGLTPTNSCVQVEVIDQRMFGAVLCHHADIYITVMERIIA